MGLVLCFHCSHDQAFNSSAATQALPQTSRTAKSGSQECICRQLSVWFVQVTQLEQNMNFLVGTMFLLQVFISVLCALGQNAFNTSRLAQMWYVTAPM